MREQDEVLAELMELYTQARVATDQAAAIDQGDAVMDVCRYCAGYWQRWEGSRLDGHAACIVTERFKAQLAQAFRDSPTMTINQVAAALGITKNVIRSWHQVGLTRLDKVRKPKRNQILPIRVWEQKSKPV